MMFTRLPFFAVCAGLAVWLEHAFHSVLPGSPEILLAVLAGAAFFLTFAEFLPLILFGTWLLGWPWRGGFAVPAFIGVLILVFAASRLVPLRSFFAAGVFAAAAALGLLVCTVPYILPREPLLAVQNVLVTGLLSAFFFWVCREGMGYKVPES